MTQITLKLTASELNILTGLAAEQLFRKEFIDCRLPGFTSNAPDLQVGKQLVQRMRLAAGHAPVRTASTPMVRTSGRQA